MLIPPDVFSAANIAERLREVEAAHKTSGDPDANWVNWYAQYLAPRLSADVRAATWTPEPTKNGRWNQEPMPASPGHDARCFECAPTSPASIRSPSFTRGDVVATIVSFITLASAVAMRAM